MRSLISCLIVVTLFACSKKGSTQSDEKPGSIPGMGESKLPATGTPFEFPKGISLVSDLIPGFDLETNFCNVSGTGNQVVLELKLKNTLNVDTAFYLPAGLVFEFQSVGTAERDDTYQDGILLERIRIRVPKGGVGPGGDTCSVKLLLYCLNKKRRAVDNAAPLFKIGPITDSRLMGELIDLLKNKKIAFENQEDYNYTCDLLQVIVWHITDGDGLTDDDRAIIAEFPSR